LMKKGCIHCGSKNLIEYSEESEEVVCHRCYESM
jgi:DNA-directed RNA polymerase subunit RPC12/RpoP